MSDETFASSVMRKLHDLDVENVALRVELARKPKVSITSFGISPFKQRPYYDASRRRFELPEHLILANVQTRVSFSGPCILTPDGEHWIRRMTENDR